MLGNGDKGATETEVSLYRLDALALKKVRTHSNEAERKEAKYERKKKKIKGSRRREKREETQRFRSFQGQQACSLSTKVDEGPRPL